MTDKIRIKDIAERAGVSVGTVDRVLHNRPNVSKTALEKVNKALKEMDYKPNMYASALAYNKQYSFFMMIPKHEQEAYWEEIEEGAMKDMEARRDFHINVTILYYERYNQQSFSETSLPNALNTIQMELLLCRLNLSIPKSLLMNCTNATFHLCCSIPICPIFVHFLSTVRILSVVVISLLRY